MDLYHNQGIHTNLKNGPFKRNLRVFTRGHFFKGMGFLKGLLSDYTDDFHLIKYH